MPRTIDSIVACHQAARSRLRAGRPVWDLQIPIKTILADYRDAGDDLSAERAVEMSHRVHAMLSAHIPKAWLDSDHHNFSLDLDDLLCEFKEATVAGFSNEDLGSPVEQLNDLLDGLYDWGDQYRVWIG